MTAVNSALTMKCPLASGTGVHTRGGIKRFLLCYVTLNEPFMIEAWGSQTNLYVPFFSVTVQVNVPFAPTPVFLFRPGPERWKLWMFDKSFMTILTFPAFRLATFWPPFLSVIVQPGPTTPLSVVVAAEADATTTRAAAGSVTSTSRVRSMRLLCAIQTPSTAMVAAVR